MSSHDEQSTQPEQSSLVAVVGIGASAGGLQQWLYSVMNIFCRDATRRMRTERAAFDYVMRRQTLNV